MGAFDTYEGTSRCPRCDDVLYLNGQTKVFDPSFGGLCHRHFTPGRTQALDFPPSQMLETAIWDDWCRIRPPVSDDRSTTTASSFERPGCVSFEAVEACAISTSSTLLASHAHRLAIPRSDGNPPIGPRPSTACSVRWGSARLEAPSHQHPRLLVKLHVRR